MLEVIVAECPLGALNDRQGLFPWPPAKPPPQALRQGRAAKSPAAAAPAKSPAAPAPPPLRRRSTSNAAGSKPAAAKASVSKPAAKTAPSKDVVATPKRLRHRPCNTGRQAGGGGPRQREAPAPKVSATKAAARAPEPPRAPRPRVRRPQPCRRFRRPTGSQVGPGEGCEGEDGAGEGPGQPAGRGACGQVVARQDSQGRSARQRAGDRAVHSVQASAPGACHRA